MTTDLLAHIRKRPGMYVGSVNIGGYHQMLWEVLDAALHYTDGTRNVTVRTAEDGSAEVIFDGAVASTRAVHAAFTVLDFGPPFGNGGGVLAPQPLLSVVVALSRRVEVWVAGAGHRDGFFFADGGNSEGDLVDAGPGIGVSTITMWPDPEIFGPIAFGRERIEGRLAELRNLHPEVTYAYGAGETEL